MNFRIKSSLLAKMGWGFLCNDSLRKYFPWEVRVAGPGGDKVRGKLNREMVSGGI